MRTHAANLDERSESNWLQEAAKFEQMAARCSHNPVLRGSFRELAADARDKAQSIARRVSG